MAAAAHHAADSNGSDFGEVQLLRVLCAWHLFSVGFDISLAISIGRGRRFDPGEQQKQPMDSGLVNSPYSMSGRGSAWG